MKGEAFQRTTDIYKLADQVRAAQRDVDAARRAVEDDKLQRAGRTIARIVDALTTTQPEAVLNDAEERVVVATENGRRAAREWVVAKALETLAERAAEAAQHKVQAKKLERAHGRERQVRHWLELVQNATNRLEDARRACDSASTTELLDLVTTNKAVSALSYLETSSAADAVKGAHSALQALTNELPKRADQADLDKPDDLIDLLVDLSDITILDVFSWSNMERLDHAARQCGQAEVELHPLLMRLSALATDVQVNVERERAALQAIEAPLIAAAEGQVPDVLRVRTPMELAS